MVIGTGFCCFTTSFSTDSVSIGKLLESLYNHRYVIESRFWTPFSSSNLRCESNNLRITYFARKDSWVVQHHSYWIHKLNQCHNKDKKKNQKHTRLPYHFFLSFLSKSTLSVSNYENRIDPGGLDSLLHFAHEQIAPPFEQTKQAQIPKTCAKSGCTSIHQ